MDTKNLIEVLDVVGTLAQVIKEAKEDGHLDWWDAPKFLKLLPATHKALEDINQVGEEVSELTFKEGRELASKLLEVVGGLLEAILTE